MLVLATAASIVARARRDDAVERRFGNFEKPRFGEIFLFRNYFRRNGFSGKSALDKTGFTISEDAYPLASKGYLFNLEFDKLL